MALSDLHFWVGFGQIVGIDLVLSGDNAVVIALASRGVPPDRRRLTIILGAAAAVVLRVVLAFVIFRLLMLPYLRLIGGLLLLWIAIGLGRPQRKASSSEASANVTTLAAIRTILVADLLMSIDNVVAVAGAAHGDLVLLILGLGISIPIVVYGSTLMLRLMSRHPWVVLVGIALIGWVAGDMIAAEPGVATLLRNHFPAYQYLLPGFGIAVAFLSGWVHRQIGR